MHRKVAAAIVAALALAVASCGGSEKTTLDRAALVRRVELACREGQRASEREAKKSRATDGFNFDALLVGQRTVVDKIEDLDTTGAAKRDFDTFKDGMRTRLDLIERVASADRADQPRVLRSVQADANKLVRKLETATRRLGLRGCA
jgi:hypothetical protein